ncbi:MAG: hypothetical protein ACOZAN_02680 [Patescibacteria group bacterium]
MKNARKNSPQELHRIQEEIERDEKLIEESRKKTARRRKQKEIISEKPSSWERVFAHLILIATVAISYLIMLLAN